MGKSVTVFLIAAIFLAIPLAGCIEEGVSEKKEIDAEELIEAVSYTHLTLPTILLV